MRAVFAAMILASVAVAGCVGDAPGPGDEHEVPVADPDDPFAVMTGFNDPLLVTHAGDGSGRLFVVEQGGTVIAVAPDGTRSKFGDLAHRIRTGGEQGLLGMAFHPDFVSNGVVLASYTDVHGDSIIERFRLGDDGAIDFGTAEYILRVKQPYTNHNGGHILYGPDGYLYMGLGDGGSIGDPHDHGQRKKTKLGSILRIDVGPTGDYTIPSDNPYADGKFGAPEVWLYGLRNPWRFSFDATGNLWIGDVGQGAREEINRVAPDQAGSGLGWNEWEGTIAYPNGRPYDPNEDDTDQIFPVAEYSHKGGHCSVTGGEVVGNVYVFADYCSGTIWSMPQGGELGSAEVLRETSYRITSFGQDEDGNVYIVDHGGVVERFNP